MVSNHRKVNMVRRRPISTAVHLRASMELLPRNRVMAHLGNINNSHLRVSMDSNHLQDSMAHHLQANTANNRPKDSINHHLDLHLASLGSNHPQANMAHPRHRVNSVLHLPKASSVRQGGSAGHQLRPPSVMVRCR